MAGDLTHELYVALEADIERLTAELAAETEARKALEAKLNARPEPATHAPQPDFFLKTALAAETEARKALEVRLAALEKKPDTPAAWTFRYVKDGEGRVMGIDAKKAS